MRLTSLTMPHQLRKYDWCGGLTTLLVFASLLYTGFAWIGFLANHGSLISPPVVVAEAELIISPAIWVCVYFCLALLTTIHWCAASFEHSKGKVGWRPWTVAATLLGSLWLAVGIVLLMRKLAPAGEFTYIVQVGVLVGVVTGSFVTVYAVFWPAAGSTDANMYK